MKHLSILLVLFVLCSCKTGIDPQLHNKKPSDIKSIETYIAIRSNGNPQSANGKDIYYISWETGVNQLYLTSEGNTAQITKSEDFPEGIDGYNLSPDGNSICIESDIGGDEQYDLYMLKHDVSTKPIKIEHGREVRAGNIKWANDSKSFFYRSNRRNGKDFDFWKYDLVSEQTNKIMDLEGYTAIHDVSQDNQKLLFAKYYGGGKSDLFILDINAKSTTSLTESDRETGYYGNARFIKSDESIMFLTDDNFDHSVIATMQISSKSMQKASDVSWPVDFFTLSENKETLVYVYNEQGYSKLKIVDSLGEKLPTPELKIGRIGSLELKNNILVFTYNNPAMTSEVFSFDIKSQKTKQHTSTDYLGIDTNEFVNPEFVSFKSFDGLEIPAFIYKPKGYENRPAPYIIYAHGGPQSQFRPGFIRNYQYLLKHGIGIIAPNVRGSSGYGREYLALDNYKKRMNAIKDFKATADYLINSKIADPKRIAITGGSYGGFVVMACITEYPDLFKAAIKKYGIVNFVSYFKNTKGYRRKVRESEYGPMSDVEFLKSISPIEKIDRVKTPLLIIHGENDPRVPVDEARQIVKALEKRNQSVEALIFPDEGHGISKLENRTLAYKKLTGFLIKHLEPNPD